MADTEDRQTRSRSQDTVEFKLGVGKASLAHLESGTTTETTGGLPELVVHVATVYGGALRRRYDVPASLP